MKLKTVFRSGAVSGQSESYYEVILMRSRLISLVILFALVPACNALVAGDSDTKPTQQSERQQADKTPDGPIQDNSFLIEEAYNQEDGVIQHISFFQRLANSKDWVYTLTDEWPLRTQKHQFSTTFVATHADAFGGAGIGDTAPPERHRPRR